MDWLGKSGVRQGVEIQRADHYKPQKNHQNMMLVTRIVIKWHAFLTQRSRLKFSRITRYGVARRAQSEYEPNPVL